MFSAISSPEKNKVTHDFFIIKWLSDIKKTSHNGSKKFSAE